MGARRPRFVSVLQHVQARRPDIGDPVHAIEERILLVGGRIVTNPRALVPSDASVVVRPRRPLRGEDKLRCAIDAFGVDVMGRTCLDLAAAAGGFTRVLLERGAAKVLALDAGFGQLRGELRSHSRVINLEQTNLGHIARAIPHCWKIDVVTMDLSYLSVARATPQLDAVRFAQDADLVALVKPMFELGLGAPPSDARTLGRALDLAVRGVETGGRWRETRTMPSPIVGGRGAREFLLAARRAPGELRAP